jgi:hypothetical protein
MARFYFRYETKAAALIDEDGTESRTRNEATNLRTAVGMCSTALIAMAVASSTFGSTVVSCFLYSHGWGLILTPQGRA